MKRTTHPIILLTVWLLVLASTEGALAQWNYQVNLTGSYDGNPYGLNGAAASSFLSASAGAAYFARNLGVGYKARITGYDQAADLSSYLHQAYFNIGNDNTGLHTLAEQRMGTQSSLYDYLVIRSTLSHRFGCAGFRCTLSAAGSLFRFDELPERNQGKIVSTLRMSRSFQTKTSLIGTLGAGYTHYTDLMAGLESDPVDSGDDNVTQLILGLRVAQSLAPTTGLAAYYQQRIIQGVTSITFVDEESGASYALLDDPSLYSNRAVGIELTKMMLDYRLSVKLGGSYAYRDYPSQGVYLETGEYETDTLREDRYATVWMLAEWTVSTGRQNITIELAGQWSNNTSNSYWYDHQSSYLSLGLGFGL